MSNSGVGAGAGGTTAQKQRALLQKADADVGSLIANFSALINIVRVNDPPVRNSQEAFQMDMRAARMVHSADSVLKLVSELERAAIFSGLASLSGNVDRRIEVLSQQAEGTDKCWRGFGRRQQQALRSWRHITTHLLCRLCSTIEVNISLSLKKKSVFLVDTGAQ